MIDPSSPSAPDAADGPDGRDGWDIEDVYDPETLALIDRPAAAPPVPVPVSEAAPSPAPNDPSRRIRSGMTGMMMAGMMVGVADVLDPDRLQPEMVEFTPDRPDPESMPVQFVHVPGDPRASRIIIRRWLFGH